MKYLLDTNTLIYFFRGAGAVSKTLLQKPPSHIALPSIVVSEIRYGLAKIGNPKGKVRQFEGFLSATQVLPFGELEAITAANIRSYLEKSGSPIGPFDTLIAATALAGHYTLVTHNVSEFKRVKDLIVEDWY